MLIDDRPTDLYRHFDADGRLLYVGISLSTAARLTQHRATSHWFHKIARVEIEKHPSRHTALKAEKQAILNERPICNLLFNEAASRKAADAKKLLANNVPVNEWAKWVAYHPMYAICWCEDGVDDAPKGEDVESHLCSEQIVYGVIGKSSVAVMGHCDYCGRNLDWRDLAKTENPFCDADGVCLWGDKWPYLPDGSQLSAIDQWCRPYMKSGRLRDFVFIPDIESCGQGEGQGGPFTEFTKFAEEDVVPYIQWLKESGWAHDPPRFMVEERARKGGAKACS